MLVHDTNADGGGRVVPLPVWLRVGKGPSVLAVGAGAVSLVIFFSRLSFLLPFSLSLGDSLIKTLSQRAVKPKTTNQQTFADTFCLA